MDGGGGDQPNGHVHPFVAQKRLEMQARIEKRLRKRSKSEQSEQAPLLANDALSLDNDGALDELSSDDEDDEDAGGPPPPGAEISALAESVK